MRKVIRFIEKHEVLLLILCFAALMRIPSLYEPARYADEDIYLTIGQNLKRGLVLYKEVFDNKTPLVYYLAALAGNVSGFRLILLFWNLTNIFFIWKLAEKILKKSRLVMTATALFAIFSTLPLLEGEIANGEVFMILPTTIAVYLLFDKEGEITKKARAFFWSGIFWSIAFLFKTPPLFEMAGILFYLTFFQSRGFKILLLIAGFLLPLVVFLVYFYAIGALPDFVTSVFVQNIPYLSAWGGGGGIFSGGLATRGLLLVVGTGIIFLAKKELSHHGLVFLWFGFALFGALLSGRPYPHYLIQVVPSGSLLLALVLFEKEKYVRAIGLGLLFLLAISIVRYRFWYYKSLPYYQNFIEYAVGRKTKEQYFRYWGGGVTDNLAAGAFIRTATKENDTIFVWGTEPGIYWLANRQPATRYTTAYHILNLGAQEVVYEEIVKKKPRAIIIVTDEKNFSQLNGLLATEYALAKKIGHLEVYLRLL